MIPVSTPMAESAASQRRRTYRRRQSAFSPTALRQKRRGRQFPIARLVVAILAALLLYPAAAAAYLHFTVSIGGREAVLKWSRTPVRWFATERGDDGITPAEFQSVMARAFETWQDVPSASIAFSFAGFTGADPFDDDNMSVLGFQNQPEMERVLGATGFVIDTLTGEIVESDIFFNSAFQWSTAAAGDSSRFDLETVAVHEIGHFLGLGHSALGETEVWPDGGRRVLAAGAAMFPIAFGRGNTLGRELQPDDVAGVSDLYPDGGFRQNTGTVRGRIIRGGAGVLGAHVVAFHPETRALVGGFTLNRDGEFQIAGLEPGLHVIRVEPLDDADLESFFSPRDPIDIAFQVTFHERLFVAPAGGAGDRVTVSVRPK